MKKDKLINRLTQDIEPLPVVASRILHHLRQDITDFRELTKVIETDPALCTMIIGLANSPLYGSIQHPISSLKRAILILGQPRTIDMILMYAIRSMNSDSSAAWPKEDLQYWNHCVGVALGARMLAKLTGTGNVKESFLAGLVHDIGKLALLNDDAAAYRAAIDYAAQSNRPLHFVELESFGVTHAMISGAICRKWGLPETVVEAAAYHHDSSDALDVARIVRSANLLVKIAGIGDCGNPFGISSQGLLLPHPRINKNDIYKILALLPQMVEELSGVVFGHQRPPGLPEGPSLAVQVQQSRISSDQLLAQYLLFSLGYNRALPSGASQPAINPPTINLSPWLAGQPIMPQNELNITSLRTWLEEQLKVCTESLTA